MLSVLTMDLNVARLYVTLAEVVTRVLLHRTPHHEPVHCAIQRQL